MARLTTESYTKIFLILLLGVLVCGALAFGSCSAWPVRFGGGALSEIGNAEVDAAGVKNIEIDWAAGSVDVKTHNSGGNIILTESTTGGMSKAQSMRWQVVGNTLKIDYGTWFSCMSMGSKHLEISIPQNLAKDLGEFDLDGASGSYTVSGLDCGNFKAGLASGSLDARDITTQNLKLETASGNAYFEGDVENELKVDTAAGQVQIISKHECPRTIDADMASGAIIVSIPENDGFTVEIDELSGNFQTDFAVQQNGDTYIYKNGGASFKADMASGKFILKKSS